jgi:hypothetical protein
MSTGNRLIQEITDAYKAPKPEKAWQSRCRELAQWAWNRLAIKRDRHGRYLSDGSASWTFSPVTQENLAAHFAGEITLGLGEASQDDQCLWVAWDMDNHGSDIATNANLDYAIVLMNQLVEYGFRPIVEDSDGKGGIHVWVLFSSPIPCATAFRFAEWMVRDSAKHNVEKVELRPHAATVQTGERCGLYLRTPGKHHKRNHWSRIWGDGEWLEAAEGIEYLLSSTGDDPALLPEIKLPPAPKPLETQHWQSDDAVVERARKYVSRIPGAVSGSGGHNDTFHVACVLVKDFVLSIDQAFEVISEWNATCVPEWSEHELRHKINSALKAPGETGRLRDASPNRYDSITIPKYQPKQDGKAAAVVVRSFAGIDASELATFATLEPDWLVQDVFTIDEPLLVGARSKGCKTLQLTDLAVAVASQTTWMNIFDVPKRRKVLFITGEANYRRIAKHIEKACKVRGLQFGDLKGYLRIEAVEFPCLPRLADQDAIRKDIETHGFEVVIADPLYRGLSGVDSSRLGEMGDAIKSFQAACAPACMVLSHHVVKSAAREYGSPPQLEDMTGAGIAESCGQWWLVGRNEKYAWDWKHDLCVQFGGREGQGGGRRVLFNEHDWTFQVDHWHEYTEQAQADEQQRRDDVRREADERKRTSARVMILKAVRNVKSPQSKNAIRESCGAVQADFRVVFPEMLQDMTLVQRPYRDSQNRIQSAGYLLNEYVSEYDKSDMLVDVG